MPTACDAVDLLEGMRRRLGQTAETVHAGRGDLLAFTGIHADFDASMGCVIMTTPDGVATRVPAGRRGPAATRTDVYRPLLDHIRKVLAGDTPIATPDVEPLPEVCRAVLRGDGIDPNSVAALAHVVDHFVVRIGRRKHVARLKTARKDARHRDAGTVHPRPAGATWIDLRFDIGRDPRMHVTGRKLVVHQPIPDVVAASLDGRPATDVVRHPALREFRLSRVAATQFGFIATLIRDSGMNQEKNRMTDVNGMHALRITTIRLRDDHRTSTVIGVEDLRPDRDIVGRSGPAVATLIAGDEDLEGQHPYLYNALQGQFAVMAHDHVPGSVRRHRTCWSPTHDLELLLGDEAS